MGDQNALLRFLAAQVTQQQQQQQQQQISAALAALNGSSLANSTTPTRPATSTNMTNGNSGSSGEGSVSVLNGTTPNRNGQHNSSSTSTGANNNMNQIQEILLWQMLAAQQAQAAQMLNLQQLQQQAQQAQEQQRMEWLQKELLPKELLRQQQKLKQQLEDQQKQQQQQQQKVFDDVIRKLAEAAKNGHRNGQNNGHTPATNGTDKPSTSSSGATVTVKEGAEIKLNNTEASKKSTPVNKTAQNAFNKNAIDAAMWQLLAAQMLQQQNVLKNSTSKQNKVTSSKKDPYSAGLDIAAKIKAEQQANVVKSENISTNALLSGSHIDPSDANKKRLPATETQARVPLGLGWRRQTCIRAITASGVRGDVIYYAPCGKKLSTYAEVLRYLMKNLCGPINRDNFSFSSKLVVGEFIYPKDTPEGEKIIAKLSEEEVNDEINKLASLRTQPKITEKKSKEVKERAFTPEEEDLADPEEFFAPKGWYEDEEKVKWSREPIDDLLLTEIRPLPELPRVKNLELNSEGFADVLMVYEFVSNFGLVLNIGPDMLPTVQEMCAGLCGDSRYAARCHNLSFVLLELVLEFPGMPMGKKGKNELSQSINDLQVCRENYSEVMRQFLASRDAQGKKLAKFLEVESFETLRGEQQAAILAFFCNELLSCRNIVRSIDRNLDEIGRLKGDRWLRDGKARALRAHQKRKRRELHKNLKDNKEVKEHAEEDGEERPASRNSDSEEEDSPVHPNNKKLTPGLGQVEILTEEEEKMTAEELEEVILNLNKESDELKDKITDIANRVRTFPFGWDRYHRQYWQLPHSKAVLVESVESGGVNNPACNISEICDKDPDAILVNSFVDPDVIACVEDLVDEVALSRCKLDKKSKKRARRLDNAAKRGWWIVDSKETVEAIRSSLHGRGIRERCLHRLLCKNWFVKDLHPIPFEVHAAMENLSLDQVNVHCSYRLSRHISDLEHRIYDAQLTNPAWSPRDEDAPNIENEGNDFTFNPEILENTDNLQSQYSLESARERLLECEQAVERRYLRLNFYSSGLPSAARILGLADSDDGSDVKAEVKTEIPEEKMEVQEASSGSDVKKEEKMEVQEASTASDEKVEKTDKVVEEKPVKEEIVEKDMEVIDDSERDLLDIWRDYVKNAKTFGQLGNALQCLDNSIAWERSISEAKCQICRCVGDADQLLLCDNCQMGYHMKCFRPNITGVPNGDWFCPRCREQASGKPTCVLCCKDGAPIYPCRKCDNFFHIECTKQVTPDLPSEYVCLFCDKGTGRRVFMLSECEEPRETEEAPVVAPPPEEPVVTTNNGRKGQKRKAEGPPPLVFPMEMNKELCGLMLDELIEQPYAIPFLDPVDNVPGYHEIISNPIDLSTIREKLDSFSYQCHEEFAFDLDLMFGNCRTFNEDDSPVGAAGRNLNKFFQKRWKQIKYNYSKRLRRMQASQANASS